MREVAYLSLIFTHISADSRPYFNGAVCVWACVYGRSLH